MAMPLFYGIAKLYQGIHKTFYGSYQYQIGEIIYQSVKVFLTVFEEPIGRALKVTIAASILPVISGQRDGCHHIRLGFFEATIPNTVSGNLSDSRRQSSTTAMNS